MGVETERNVRKGDDEERELKRDTLEFVGTFDTSISISQTLCYLWKSFVLSAVPLVQLLFFNARYCTICLLHFVAWGSFAAQYLVFFLRDYETKLKIRESGASAIICIWLQPRPPSVDHLTRLLIHPASNLSNEPALVRFTRQFA